MRAFSLSAVFFFNRKSLLCKNGVPFMRMFFLRFHTYQQKSSAPSLATPRGKVLEIYENQPKTFVLGWYSNCGGDGRDRTVERLTASQTLSQLSYAPTAKIINFSIRLLWIDFANYRDCRYKRQGANRTLLNIVLSPREALRLICFTLLSFTLYLRIPKKPFNLNGYRALFLFKVHTKVPFFMSSKSLQMRYR